MKCPVTLFLFSLLFPFLSEVLNSGFVFHVLWEFLNFHFVFHVLSEFLNLNFAFKYGGCGTCHEDQIGIPVPENFQFSAEQLYGNLIFGKTV